MGGCGRGTHRDEREGAARVDRDAKREPELGAAADAVEEALGSAAGKQGGRPGGDVETADVEPVLRFIMGEHTEKELKTEGLFALCREPVRRTVTSAKVPLRSIATPRRLMNWALPPLMKPPAPLMMPSTPLVPVPARVVVAPVAISTRRIR